MERNTFNVLFYVRKDKLKRDGNAPLFMRLTVDRKRWDSALKVGIDPSRWDQKTERATGDDSNSLLVNETIASTKFRIHKIKLAIEDEGKLLTLEAVKNKFWDKEKSHRKILELFQKHNEECEMKVGVQITNCKSQTS